MLFLWILKSPLLFINVWKECGFSKAKPDQTTEYNCEGTHWSLVVIDVKNNMYYHMALLAPLNNEQALMFSKNINAILQTKTLCLKNKECQGPSDWVVQMS